MNPTEALVQQRITAAYVEADAFDCVLTREENVSDGEGGYITQKVTLPAQRLRLNPLQDAASERTSNDGTSLAPGYMLVGPAGADIRRRDTFTKDGRRYEVTFVLENRQYQTKAEVTYLG